MHLLYCDESNLESRRGDFLLYAGVAIQQDRAPALSAHIDQIRAEAGIPPTFNLKFNPAPPGMLHSDFIGVKQAILASMVEHGVGLLAYAVLHDVARDPDEARRSGINTVLFHFDCLLNRYGEGPGIVLIDRFNDAGNIIDHHLVSKFSEGVTFPNSNGPYRLRNILGVHYSAIGQSHFASLVDIAVGSLRFAINAHCRQEANKLASANNILQLLRPLLIRDNDGRVSELGFMFSPKTVNFPPYRAKYVGLKQFLAAAGIETAQNV
ncbi:DUF3800 domain-containing protein [Sinorhizobium medicae]|nr:DUF3800 domain-containing protein [Sinorhizobium medicae]